MGNPKQKWTAKEEEALRAGIAKHGTGKWKNIQQDPEFNPHLSTRSNIDLKDKWRNMSVGSGEKSRTPKPKLAAADAAVAAAVPMPIAQAPAPLPTPAAAAVAIAPTSTDVTMEDTKPVVMVGTEVKIASKYDPMIFEAIAALTRVETNVVDISAIISFIEQRQELPQNGRKQVTSRLRRLVQKEKLEKIQNSYRFKESNPTTVTNAPPVTQAPSPKKEVKSIPLKSTDLVTSDETVEEAAVSAACRIAEAENKSFVAAEAVKEVERILEFAEESESNLQLANQIFEKCKQNTFVGFVYDYAIFISVSLSANLESQVSKAKQSSKNTGSLDMAGSQGETVMLS
ncbi:unnamed protein product [Linum trigynum]|uniref:MYB transcription factor n=1 Tax=Linum trigynum TaxID=586398 RepID=A0AAV2GT49_9ROSI